MNRVQVADAIGIEYETLRNWHRSGFYPKEHYRDIDLRVLAVCAELRARGVTLQNLKQSAGVQARKLRSLLVPGSELAYLLVGVSRLELVWGADELVDVLLKNGNILALLDLSEVYRKIQ